VCVRVSVCVCVCLCVFVCVCIHACTRTHTHTHTHTHAHTRTHTHTGALDDLDLAERDAAKCMELLDTDEDGTIVKDEFLQLAVLVKGIMDVREKEENLNFLQQVLMFAKSM
jgi:hypothetical protein